MANELVPDAVWEIVEPLLPKVKRRFTYPGRKRVDDRVAFRGILFVLETGIPWEDFPKEMGCSGMTLWQRLKEWQEANVWEKLHQFLLGKLRYSDQIDRSCAVADSGSVRAVLGVLKPAPAL